MRTRSLVAALFAAVLAVGLVGCSGPPAATSDADEGGADGAPARTERDRAREGRNLAAAETFDAGRYPLRAPERSEEVPHQVPARLMSSKADQGVTQTLEGFRIQVYSAQDKQASEEFREQVRRWWQEAKGDAPAGAFSDRVPIVIEYAQPYYRVRLGAFASRERAETALKYVQRKYPDAFMARSTVTVTRE
jgi:hypothetical protein